MTCRPVPSREEVERMAIALAYHDMDRVRFKSARGAFAHLSGKTHAHYRWAARRMLRLLAEAEAEEEAKRG